MRLFILVLILIFGTQSLAKADDISEFEIEGISIGDSLLDYMSTKEIEKWFELTKNHYKYLKEPLKFREVYIVSDPNFEIYTNLSFFVKPNDKKYKIFSLRGMKDYINDMSSCLNQRNKIRNEIEKVISKYDKFEAETKSPLDKSGKSYTSNINYTLYAGDQIVLACNDWEETFRKKKNYTEGLSVVLETKEIKNWLTNY